MMDINDLVLNDDALAVIDEGQWVAAGEKALGVEFFVVGLKSQDAKKHLKELQAVARKKNRGKPLTEEQYAECMQDALINVVLKDWRGLTSNGEELIYSKDLAEKFIRSRGGETFSMMVLEAAATLDAEANDYVEEVSKN